MRADSALSHLYPDELCIVILKDGREREARWNKADWRFEYTSGDGIVDFDDIKEWRPVSIPP